MATRPARLITSIGCVVVVLAGAAQAPARRVVSLVPAITEMIVALDAAPQVVGISSFDDSGPEVASRPRVGALLDPDVERILALRPDLVVMYGSQTDLRSQLDNAGIRAFIYRHAGLESIFATLQELGAAIGRSAEATRLSVAIRKQLDAVRARTRSRTPVRTLLVFERDPTSLRGMYVSGGIGFLHDMLEIAGGRNVFADIARESVQPSLEALLARAPEVILEIRANGLSTAAGPTPVEPRAWAALASVPAVRDGRIYALTGDYLVVPGPRVAEATEAFARVLHPESFR